MNKFNINLSASDVFWLYIFAFVFACGELNVIGLALIFLYFIVYPGAEFYFDGEAKRYVALSNQRSRRLGRVNDFEEEYILVD